VHGATIGCLSASSRRHALPDLHVNPPDAATAPAATDLERLTVDTIRVLAMDAVEAANSGHPGTPMALAPVAYTLFSKVMNHDPRDPDWPDRDRFVLSAGHASILLYASLHLSGYDLALDDLKQFRQWGSRTPGHPERERPVLTPGVETTTGPLGQGIGNAVGMAMAERALRERYGSEVIDHRIYTICSDGDLMEGVSSEASSLAGHLKLGRLIAIYDDNTITIDGHTDLAFAGEDVDARYRAYGWRTFHLPDVNGARGNAARGSIRRFRARADPRQLCDRVACAEQAQHARRPRRAPGRG